MEDTQQIKDLTKAIAALHPQYSDMYRPNVVVVGPDVPIHHAMEVIRRTDQTFMNAGTVSDKLSPANHFKHGLAKLVHSPKWRPREDGESVAENFGKVVEDIRKWKKAWGYIDLECLTTDFVYGARSGWITPLGKVGWDGYESRFEYLTLADLARDAIALASAFPWLVADISFVEYDSTIDAPKKRWIAASVHIEGGEAGAAMLVHSDEQEKAYTKAAAKYEKQREKERAMRQGGRWGIDAHWTIDQLSDLWRDALDRMVAYDAGPRADQ